MAKTDFELIDFERDLAPILPLVQLPGRYSGGEFGALPGLGPEEYEEKAPHQLMAAIAFPDLYEIGMSNLAIKLIYRELNAVEGLRCERVFMPAPEMEEQLRDRKTPLSTIESGIPLRRLDLIGISIGYELAATNILAMLELGGVPLDRQKRKGQDPLVIAGGPAVTNPAPFARFFDGIYIGEAEEVLSDIGGRLSELKKRGASRDEQLLLLESHPSVWTETKDEGGIKTTRGILRGFDAAKPKSGAGAGPMPVPSIDVVQDHGVVEIMRGCPNGCRFCHAGMHYRPYRRKSYSTIIAEVDYLVHRLGYREITLSSLSSGDFSGLGPLVRYLNARYAGMGVSFALPSLRIDSFTLPLLQEISHVRKSGLTFAVETPRAEWQQRVNKPVPLEKVVQILAEARERGWNMAKFYFMIGLPEHVYGDGDEAEEIVRYLGEVRKKSGFRINANIGTFIPKPHTPYQWARLLDEEEALDRIRRIRAAFKRSPVRVAYHSPFISFLEGVISRGDRRVGDLMEKAYRMGARLDAWEEHLSVEIWRRVFEEAEWNVKEETCRRRAPEEPLPWDSVDLGVKREYLLEEWNKSREGILTDACTFPCRDHCGVCLRKLRPTEGEDDLPDDEYARKIAGEAERTNADNDDNAGTPEGTWFLFEFRKEGRARFLSHINVMTVFERSFQRAGMLLEYSKGYNPKPRLEFAHPLTLGIESDAEICRAKVLTLDSRKPEAEELKERLSGVFPEGILVTRLGKIAEEFARGKGKSLMSKYAGSSYLVFPADEELEAGVKELEEKYGGGFLSVERRGEEGKNHIKVTTAGSGVQGKALKNLMAEFGGPGIFLSRYRVLRKKLYAQRSETCDSKADEEREDYFTQFTNMYT